MQPHYFLDLIVENVKCFKGRKVLDLSDGNGKPARWTIILGENGTGKTTLLKSLATFHMESVFAGNKLTQNIDYLQLVTSLDHSHLELNQLYRGSLSGGGVIEPGFNIDVKPDNGSEEERISFTSIVPNRITRLKPYAFGASRRMGNGSLTETQNPDPVATLFSDDAALINAEAWLLETDFAIANAKDEIKKYLEKRYELVKETLKKLLPDVLDFRIKKITKTKTQAAIEVKTHYGWVAMKELSYGYLTFIGWVVDLAARMFDRYPDSKNPLAEPAIVLVDEIDLHLHPKWQRQIIEFLTKIFSETQFIVTAHSPLIVQAAENANLVLLKREGDGVKIYNDMEKEAIEGWRIDQVLASDLFGLESTRPPAYDKHLKRQKELLSKKKLTAKDESELVGIGKELEKMSLTNDISNESVKVLQKALKILQPNDQD